MPANAAQGPDDARPSRPWTKPAKALGIAALANVVLVPILIFLSGAILSGMAGAGHYSHGRLVVGAMIGHGVLTVYSLLHSWLFRAARATHPITLVLLVEQSIPVALAVAFVLLAQLSAILTVAWIILRRFTH